MNCNMNCHNSLIPFLKQHMRFGERIQYFNTWRKLPHWWNEKVLCFRGKKKDVLMSCIIASQFWKLHVCSEVTIQRVLLRYIFSQCLWYPLYVEPERWNLWFGQPYEGLWMLTVWQVHWCLSSCNLWPFIVSLQFGTTNNFATSISRLATH
jgi:hypothetical protein